MISTTNPVKANEKRVCAISGAGGYVGGCIRNYFLQHDWDVLELTRQPKPGARAVPFHLGTDLAPAALAGVTALVHCAYDFSALQWREIHDVNVEGARKIFKAARAAGVERLVCISTIAAYEGCRSLYGKAKLEIEKLALADGALVIRPGLVYGDQPQAMFGKLVAQVRQSSLLPIIGGSRNQFLVHQEDLAAFVWRYADGQVSAPAYPLTAAHEQPKTFRQMLVEIGRQLGRNPRFVPLPWRLVWVGLKTAELCGVRLKFRSDSLVSMMYSNLNPDFRDNARVGLACRPLRIDTLQL